MRKNSKIRALASVVLTAAMIATMGGMTAFAENIDSVKLTKTVAASEKIQAPNATFSFTVSPVNENTIFTTVDNKKIVVYGNGPKDGACFEAGKDSISFTPDDPLSKTTDIKLDSTKFDKPGVYRYEVSETVPEEKDKYDGMIYADVTYFLDLYVVNAENGNGYEISAVKVWKNDGKSTTKLDEGKDGFEFVNTYETKNLKLTKIVTGNQADMSKKFTFKITVNGANGEKFSTNDNVANVFESGTEYTIELGNDESLEIFGLSATDTYSIEEADYSSDGYETSISSDKDTTKNDEIIVGRKISGKADKANAEITYTNTKSVTTPTGIVLTFAPYILMVALAGVFAVLFLRKRREEF